MEWFFDFILEWVLSAIIVVVLLAWAIHRGNEVEALNEGERAKRTVIEQKERINELLKENIKLKDEAKLAKTYEKILFEYYNPHIQELQERIDLYESLNPELKELPIHKKSPHLEGTKGD